MSFPIPWYKRQISGQWSLLVIFAALAICGLAGWIFLRTEVLLICVKNNNPLGIRLALLGGASANSQGSLGETPLRVAIASGNQPALEMLIEWGADINQPDEAGATALLLATSRSDSETIRYLLQHGADPNRGYSRNINFGNTPLHVAAEADNLPVVTLLVEHGVDVNSRNGDNATALMPAVMLGHLEVVSYLLDHGADLNVVDKHGVTPLRWALVAASANRARRSDPFSMIELLIARGAHINAKDADGNSPLMAYLEACDIAPTPDTHKIVAFMVTHGADPAIRNAAGKTVFDIIDDQVTRNGEEALWRQVAALIRRTR